MDKEDQLLRLEIEINSLIKKYNAGYGYMLQSELDEIRRAIKSKRTEYLKKLES